MQRCSNEFGMFGKGIFSFTCFHCIAVKFITFTFVGVMPSPHFIIKNTQTVSALFLPLNFMRIPTAV